MTDLRIKQRDLLASAPIGVWRTGLEELALRRDQETMMLNEAADVWRVKIPKEIADTRIETMEERKEDKWYLIRALATGGGTTSSRPALQGLNRIQTRVILMCVS